MCFCQSTHYTCWKRIDYFFLVERHQYLLLHPPIPIITLCTTTWGQYSPPNSLPDYHPHGISWFLHYIIFPLLSPTVVSSSCIIAHCFSLMARQMRWSEIRWRSWFERNWRDGTPSHPLVKVADEGYPQVVAAVVDEVCGHVLVPAPAPADRG